MNKSDPRPGEALDNLASDSVDASRGGATANPPAGASRNAPPEGIKGNEMFRLLIESVRDYAIFMLDPDGRVSSWNPGAANIKGYTRDEILGKHFSIFYPPEAVARRLPQYELEVARERGRYEDEGWRVRKDGTLFWANVVISAIRDERNVLVGFAKVTRDLTARRQIEELQQTERRMNEFLAMLAHELRNPLSPMQSALDVLELKPDDPATMRWARAILQRQTWQLKRLIDDLLDVSRITRGKIALHPENFDLRNTVSQVAESWRPTFESRSQIVEMSLPAVPVHVRADSVRLAQLLSNIVSNAAKFTPVAGRIAIRVRASANLASVTVADSGIGMSPDLVPRVFDLFVQGEAGLDRRNGGLGVGLTLAKSLASLLGGTLTAASDGPGKGSEFTLALPTATPDEAPEAAPVSPAHPPRTKGLHVFVVDDNEDAAEALGALLNLLGHRITVLHHGADVLREAAVELPDVILLDIGLPGMDGFEVVNSLRRLPETRATRVIACTGYGREQDSRRISNAGFDDYLVKPVGTADLERVLAD